MMMYEDQESLFLDEMEDAGKKEVKKADKVGGGSRKRGRPRKETAGGGSSMKGVGRTRDRELFESKHKDVLKPPVPGDGGTLAPNMMEAPEGKNTKYIGYAMEVGQLPWLENWNDTEAIKRNASRYFEICAKYDCKPGVAGLALALKMDRRRMWEIVNDQPTSLKMPEESRQLIKYFHQYLNALWEQMLQGGINPAAGIFLGINNFGYHNEQNIVVRPAVSETNVDLAAIEAKYSEMPE